MSVKCDEIKGTVGKFQYSNIKQICPKEDFSKNVYSWQNAANF